MNKKEREAIISLIAREEWQQGGSTGESVGRMSVIRQVAKIFNIDGEELMFDRLWEMCKMVCEQVGVEFEPEVSEDDPHYGKMSFFDRVQEFAHINGYQETVDVLEGGTCEQFYKTFRPPWEVPPNG